MRGNFLVDFFDNIFIGLFFRGLDVVSFAERKCRGLADRKILGLSADLAKKILGLSAFLAKKILGLSAYLAKKILGF